jgi:CheY-like chemotaxis protein
MPIETPFSKLPTLVIDDAPAQLSTLRGQLQMLGIQRVDGTGNPAEALRLIKANRYGLVLCDYSLGHKTDGQQLFEHLREQSLLAPGCLFFMVTAENGYASVAAASEHKPDAYLLKPITASDVESRLRAALERRKAFEPVFTALAAHKPTVALGACDALLARKDRWFMQGLQQKADILLLLGRHADARAVCQQALEVRPQLLWAQTLLARGYKAGAMYAEALQLVREIIDSPEGQRNLAAYDVMAEALEAQGDAEGAQWALRDAVTAVPSAARQRRLAECAYRNGDLDTALDALGKVVKATQGAITAQPQDTLALAAALTDSGRTAEALAALDGGRQAFGTAPAFEPVAQAIRAQALARQGDAAGAAQCVARARENLRGAKADFATVALGKAELLTGHGDDGLARLGAAISADHENPRIRQLVSHALHSTGHAAHIDRVVDAAANALKARVGSARQLMRDARIDEALSTIEAALKDYPDNTGVLLQAAQISCMALRLRKLANPVQVERIRLHLTRLDKLMPGNDRVTQMQRYFRETLAMLAEPAEAAA